MRVFITLPRKQKVRKKKKKPIYHGEMDINDKPYTLFFYSGDSKKLEDRALSLKKKKKIIISYA